MGSHSIAIKDTVHITFASVEKLFGMLVLGLPHTNFGDYVVQDPQCGTVIHIRGYEYITILNKFVRN